WQVELEVAGGADPGLAPRLVAAQDEGELHRGGAARGDRAGDEVEILDADAAARGLIDIAQFGIDHLDAADVDRGRADAAVVRVRRGAGRLSALAEQVVDAETAVRPAHHRGGELVDLDLVGDDGATQQWQDFHRYPGRPDARHRIGRAAFGEPRRRYRDRDPREQRQGQVPVYRQRPLVAVRDVLLDLRLEAVGVEARHQDD